MQCSASFLRRKIGFWMSHGILSETSVDTFSVQENVANKSATKIFFDEDFESESAMASVQDQKEGEFQVVNFTSFRYNQSISGSECFFIYFQILTSIF